MILAVSSDRVTMDGALPILGMEVRNIRIIILLPILALPESAEKSQSGIELAVHNFTSCKNTSGYAGDYKLYITHSAHCFLSIASFF